MWLEIGVLTNQRKGEMEETTTAGLFRNEVNLFENRSPCVGDNLTLKSK